MFYEISLPEMPEALADNLAHVFPALQTADTYEKSPFSIGFHETRAGHYRARILFVSENKLTFIIELVRHFGISPLSIEQM